MKFSTILLNTLGLLYYFVFQSQIVSGESESRRKSTIVFSESDDATMLVYANITVVYKEGEEDKLALTCDVLPLTGFQVNAYQLLKIERQGAVFPPPPSPPLNVKGLLQILPILPSQATQSIASILGNVRKNIFALNVTTITNRNRPNPLGNFGSAAAMSSPTTVISNAVVCNPIVAAINSQRCKNILQSSSSSDESPSPPKSPFLPPSFPLFLQLIQNRPMSNNKDDAVEANQQQLQKNQINLNVN